MTDTVLSDCLTALNEVLAINGYDELPIHHDVASRIGYHLKRCDKTKRYQEYLANQGKPKERGSSSGDKASHWKRVVQSEFIWCARNSWQVLGLDADGELWCRVITPEQKFTGKPVKFDRRMKPRAVLEPWFLNLLVRFLQESGGDTSDLRNEMKLTTEGLF